MQSPGAATQTLVYRSATASEYVQIATMQEVILYNVMVVTCNILYQLNSVQ